MIRRRNVHQGILLGILLFLILSLSLGFASAKTATSKCCQVDTASDTPTDPAPPPDAVHPVAKPLIMKSSGTAAATKTVTFKTDTDPELDFYQPCSGGDNEIHFDINVSDVDISAIKSATLTLAVWDVDYDCTGSCNGQCERDTVFLNGHQLTSPVSYLTGADAQWSTVSFEVNKDWLMDGANTVQINIDTLGSGCWCVSCDWGQLTLVVDETPEILDIEITPEYPMTENDVTFEAKIKNADGYEVTGVDWSITDIETGIKEITMKNVNQSYTNQPKAGTHGEKEVTCTLNFKNSTSGKTGSHQKSKEFKLFFEKDRLVDPADKNSEPNWFRYWKRDQAVPDMSDVNYDPNYSGFGRYDAGSGQVFLCKKAGGQHYSSAIVLNTIFGTESFGGPDVTGIDCAAEVIAHEKYHRWVREQWKTGGSFEGETDTDRGLQAADCNDRLPDTYETNTSQTANDDTDTYDLEHIKAPDYRRYGDNEYMAMRAGNGSRGVKENDWAHPGKNTTEKTAAVIVTAVAPLKTTTRSTGKEENVGTSRFFDNFSDSGIDANGNGLYDYLRVVTDINLESTGYYQVVGILRNSAGKTIGIVNEDYHFTAGVSRVNLNFDGVMIHHGGVDGPYRLDISLANGYGDLIEENPAIYTTAAFSYQKFEGQQASFAENFSDSGSDTDNDGAFDYLAIQVPVNVTMAGEYRIDGYLTSGSGKPLGYDIAKVSLSTGLQMVTLKFDGLAIASNKENGPYVLENLSIREDGKYLEYIQKAYTTSAYNYTDFRAKTAYLNDTYTDKGIDPDNNGLFNSLAVSVGVKVAVPGKYTLAGLLYDQNNNQIGAASVEAVLEPGDQALVLDFDGILIYKHMVNGPYKLKHLFLYDINGVLVSITGDAYITKAYDYKDFEHSLVNLTGGYRDYPVDSNGDNLPDLLRIEVPVSTDQTGNYALNARLMDKNGGEIMWSATSATLNAGETKVLYLDFNAQTIKNHGINGPYYLWDVYIYNTADTNINDSVKEAYVTVNHWPIANQPPIANAGPDLTVEQNISTGANVQLDGSASTDQDNNPLTYLWEWNGGSAQGVNPTIQLPSGETVITLTVSDGEYEASDTVLVKVVDTTPPVIEITNPASDSVLQGKITLGAKAADLNGVSKVSFSIREADGAEGKPIGYEDLPGETTNYEDWNYTFDTTVLLDGRYVIIAKAIDGNGNDNWSEIIPVCVKNWNFIELLPPGKRFHAGITIPLSFTIQVSYKVKPWCPFVSNEDLEIRIYKIEGSDKILKQTSHYGRGVTDYRIVSWLWLGFYTVKFKTDKQPGNYVVEVWRPGNDYMIGSFDFATVKH